MIQALLDLADALLLKTPSPFGKRPIHYFLDLDLDGNLIGISPTCRITEKGEERLGKEFECPVFFPLVLIDGEVKANGGGGISVAELATGDTMEVFRTRVVFPKGKDPSFKRVKPSASNDDGEPEPDEDVDDDDSEAESTDTKKDQFKRHANWKNLHKRLFKGIRTRGELNRHHWSLWKFIVRAKHLDSAEYLRLVTLPDPKRASGGMPEELEKERKKLKQSRNRALKDLGKAQFAFRVAGKIMLRDSAIVDWWRDEYAKLRNAIAEKLPTGDDGYRFPKSELVETTKRLTPVFPNIKGVPKSGPWCPLASFDKAPFKSYGLAKITAPVCLETAERVAGALNSVLNHPQQHYRLGNTVAVFWAVRSSGLAEPLDFCDLLDGEKNPDPLEVLNFLKNIHGHAAESPGEARFHCALLSSPKSRVTVRSWHTDTLPKVTARSRDYFETVSLPTVWGDRRTSSITELAEGTMAKSSDDRRDKKKKPPNSTYTALFNCVFFGPEAPLPYHLFVQAIRRQVLELASGFAAKSRDDFESRLRHRMALIQLFFNLNNRERINRNTIMSTSQTTTDSCNHPAILLGRLLAILDNIHCEAHAKTGVNGRPIFDQRGIGVPSTNTSPATRMYGAASSTPALAFSQLCKLVVHHLNKFRDRQMADILRDGLSAENTPDGYEGPYEGLSQIVSRLKRHYSDRGVAVEFPRTLSLEDQGRFALGFYYERCRRWPRYKKTNPDTTSNQ
jgi:CRISPR-associated protein Cas8c/Csd1 subtype I-C